jgi:cell wall-associated NlpC family hydrolase
MRRNRCVTIRVMTQLTSPARLFLIASAVVCALMLGACATVPPTVAEAAPTSPANATPAPARALKNAPSVVMPAPQLAPLTAPSQRFDVGRDRTSDVLVYALSLVGVKYKFGGNSVTTGFDCSGFVNHVFGEIAGIALPRNSEAIAQRGLVIDKNELQSGDLVFYNTRSRANSHVGIYLGNNTFVHAPSRGKGVEVVDMTENYWQKRFNGARRLVADSANISAPNFAEKSPPAKPATSRTIDLAKARNEMPITNGQ